MKILMLLLAPARQRHEPYRAHAGASVRDNAAREHPPTIPCEAICKTERLQDDNAWLSPGVLSKESKL